MMTVAGNSRKEAVWGASVRVLWWFSESTELIVFPPPRPGEEPQKNQAGGGAEKQKWWGCLSFRPPWEPHVKSDTCFLIALSQDPDCVCLYDIRVLLRLPLISVCVTVLA